MPERAISTLDRAGIIALLEAPDATELFHAANVQRTLSKGDGIFLRGIVEFSNYCARNCLYCGLRGANLEASRFRMGPERIIEYALHIAGAGIGTVVLQSGDDLRFSAAEIASIVREIKARAEIAVVLSVGEREEREYALWREAGADRYLIKHETSDPQLYSRLHPGQTLEKRLGIQRLLKSMGYEVGSGFIVGLPGQTLSTLADDVLLVRESGLYMCGVGPFVPHTETPLADVPCGSVETTLRLVALLRLAIPDINLPATTALATLAPEDGQYRALQAGANVIMPNFTPDAERAQYRIYDNKLPVDLVAAKEAAQRAGRFIIKDGRVRSP